MEPSYGKTGSKGTIRVWNKTNGYLDVSKEGHILMGQTAAWVEETDEIVALIVGGLFAGAVARPLRTCTDASATSEVCMVVASMLPLL